ncbi:MAG: class I SAM-dependent methyltransferase [Acidimicrobiaceae bacterium]|nr:class I SAM-dependent methyltransferase [Acidimicrobiaceae bacterium]
MDRSEDGLDDWCIKFAMGEGSWTVDEWSRQRLGEGGFNDGSLYDSARPTYPHDAIEFLVSSLGVDASTHVLDLGAGTGIFTRQILKFTSKVTAVEPSRSMRETLERTTPAIRVLAGRDTEIPLEDSSVGVVFVAQAFHWFDVEASLVEMHRVLVKGGGLGLIWNERDESVQWVGDLGRVMQWDVRQPYRVGTDFSDQIRRGPFENIERRRFVHDQILDHEGLYRRVLSTSYISLMEDVEVSQLMQKVERVVSSLADPVSLPYVTDVYRANAIE